MGLVPELEPYKDVGNLVVLFGSPGDCVNGCPYYSLDVDLTDGLCRGMDFFEAAEGKRQSGGQFRGGFLAYPPLDMLPQFVKEIRALGLCHDALIVLVLPSFKVREVANLLRKVGSVKSLFLCSAQNGKVLNRRAGNKMSLLIIQGKRSSPPIKRRKLR